jgi:hypothetical protein
MLHIDRCIHRVDSQRVGLKIEAVRVGKLGVVSLGEKAAHRKKQKNNEAQIFHGFDVLSFQIKGAKIANL